MIFRWIRLEKFLNYLLIFLLPTQLALHFWPTSAFVFGIRVDYLAPSIYLTDVLFISLFISWLRNNTGKFFTFVRKYKILLLLFLILAVLNTAFSTSIFPSIFKWIKLTELVLFIYYIQVRGDVFKSKTLLTTLFYSLILFSVIGILQFSLGRTLGGPLYLLGERSFDISTPGIALTQILGRSFMRAYSTFSHPNSLAGYLGLGLLVLIFIYSKKELFKKSLGMMTILAAFILTFSLSAFVVVATCAILFMLIHKKLLKIDRLIYIPGILLLASLVFLFASKIIFQNRINLPQNIRQRVELSVAAGRMISERFFWGEGLNTFVVNVQKIRYQATTLWTLQPVHNIFLLIFSETGVVGLALFYLFLIKITRKEIVVRNEIFLIALVFILTTGLFDHYWFTLQQNMFFGAFILANFFRAEG